MPLQQTPYQCPVLILIDDRELPSCLLYLIFNDCSRLLKTVQHT